MQMKKITRLAHSLVLRLGLDELVAAAGLALPYLNKLIPQPSLYRLFDERKLVMRHNTMFYLDPRDYMQWHLFSNQPDYSFLHAYRYLKLTSMASYTVIDVGANIGAFSLSLASRLGEEKINSSIYSFEPSTSTNSLLRYNCTLNATPNATVSVFDFAVGDRNCIVNLFQDELNSGASSLANNTLSSESVACQMITIDSFVESASIPKVNFMKVDVEGYDLFVIDGALNTIIRDKPGLYIEITPSWFQRHQRSEHELFEFLESNNYQIFWDNDGKLLNISSHRTLALPWQYNVLCVWQA